MHSTSKVTRSSRTLETLRAAAVAARIPFQIGFQRRWDRRYEAVRDVLEAGDVGKPVLYKAYGRDPGVSRASHRGVHRNGGLFLNCAIHDYDVLCFVARCEVDAVSATGAALVHKEPADVDDIDTCSTTLFLSRGAMAITEWSRYATYGYDIGLEVVGPAGVVHMGRGGGPGVVVRRCSASATSLLDVFGDAYERSIRAFVAAVRDGVECIPGIEDARAALRLAILARHSYQAGGGVLQISAATAMSDAASAGNADRVASGVASAAGGGGLTTCRAMRATRTARKTSRRSCAPPVETWTG